MSSVFVFDLDGTLLNDDKSIDYETIHILDQLKSLGHTVMVATGRAYEITAPYLDILEPHKDVILNNGVIVRDLEKNKNTFEKTLDFETIKVIYEYLMKENIPFSISSSVGLHPTSNYELGYYDYFLKMFTDYPLNQNMIESINDFQSIQVHKILVNFKDEAILKNHQKVMRSLVPATITKSMEGFLTILPKGVSKGDTLKQYCLENGITLDRLVVFGDNDNDVEMLQLTRHSYAMKNGSALALDAATYVTSDDNNHQGVAHTLKTLLNLN